MEGQNNWYNRFVLVLERIFYKIVVKLFEKVKNLQWGSNPMGLFFYGVKILPISHKLYLT